MNRAVYGSLMVTALAVALVLRVAAPDARPMHHDEANQAVRFGALLETGHYEYDRNDHHGPTLYYLTLPVAWLRGRTTLASLDERTIRLVPALFGAGLILLFLPLAGAIGRGAAAAGAWLAALSPALTYFARFYIQETVFVFFTLAFVIALGRYAEGPRARRAAAAGVWAGLAYATKETSVIVLTMAVVAAAVARRWAKAGAPRPRSAEVGLALTAALLVAFVFYSSFLSQPAGLVESIRAFGVYFQRGLGATTHVQPWDYYFTLLWFTHAGGFFWTEALVLALAIVGLIAAVRSQKAGFWPGYLACYSVLTAIVFSAIPYKTPWNLLPFYIGIVAVAGSGAAALLRGMPSPAARLLAIAALAMGFLHLGVQSWRANFQYPADPRNPYVYAQTVPDFLRLVQRITDVAAAHTAREAMLVKVIAGPHEQWPLPWYLRRMTRVGYWSRAGDADTVGDAPIVVASQEHDAAVEAALGDRYIAESYGLRPEVILTLHIERGLWERFLARRAGAGAGGD